MSEEQPGQEQSACPHPEAVGKRWGDPISEERQRELQGYVDQWEQEQDHGARNGPFDPEGRSEQESERLTLTGADAYWLAERSGRDEDNSVPNLHLEGADLGEAHLEGADLDEAHLEGSDLGEAHLEGANLTASHLEGSDLDKAHLEEASLVAARLEDANLFWAHLESTYLTGAVLDSKSNLAYAHILEPEDSRPLFARLLRRPRYGPALGDIHWGDFDMVQLTLLQGLEGLHRLADERELSWRLGADSHRSVVRAYRQVAQRLRDQGFSDIADRLSDRAQILQRKVYFRLLLEDWRRPWRLPSDLARWLFSWFLALLAGYGYHPGRSVFWYLATIFGFAYLFFQATHGALTLGLSPSQVQPLAWYEALVLSVSSFHGRGFFQPAGPSGLGDPVAILAAGEAVFGLLIEISFIATFTQRFFGAK